MKSRILEAETWEAVLASPVREMSPEQYLQFFETHPREVKNVRFVPPSIGSDGFGIFEVETKTPYYEVCVP